MAFEIVAQARKGQGRGASRRLRHSGKVPGILYGGKKPAVNIELDHNPLYHQLRNEKFHASVLTLALDGAKEQVLLRAVNMHPFMMQVQHVDFQRVSADEKIHIKVNRSSGPTTIDAAKGVGYREVKPEPAAKPAPKPAKKKAPGR